MLIACILPALLLIPTTPAGQVAPVAPTLPVALGAHISAEQEATRPRASRSDRVMTVSPARAEDALPPGEADVFAFAQDALKLRDENAAPLYLQAFPMVNRQAERIGEKLEEFDETPLDEVDPAAWREAMGHPGTGAEINEPAVRRTRADWGAPIDELGIATLLPYLNDARTLARQIAMEARLLAREGRHDESADMLRRLYVLGQHLGNAQDAVLVEGLVGVAISALATDRVGQIMELQDAPNRYWALTTLPTPMFDATRWLRGERWFIANTFPSLAEPDLMNAERWGRTMIQLHNMYPVEMEPNPYRDAASAFLGTFQATEVLRSRGYTPEQIEQVDLFPTAARVLVDEFHATFDAAAKLWHLPFPEAYPRMEAFDEQLAQQSQETPYGFQSLAAIVMPSLNRAFAAGADLERRIAALRIIEAVRDHAAHNGGAIPASLDAMRLPIPPDPITGKPFGYSAEGRTFRLVAAPYREGDVDSGFTWTVTVRE